jgi:hypothetical protein
MIYAFHSIDDTITGSSLENWAALIMKGTAALDKDWTVAGQYKKFLLEAGFEDVVEKKYEWPLGTWAKGKRMKTLGLWCRKNLLSALEGISLALLTRGLGMTKDEVDVLLVGVRDDLRSNRVHAYIPM